MPDPRPSIGRIVTYRSRTGGYDVPAIITATVDSHIPASVLGHLPALSSAEHVHLTVFAPSGSYQEWDIPKDLLPPEHAIVPGERAEPNPCTWRWPEPV